MSTLTLQTLSNGTVSTSSTNVIQGCAKAWVNFNGTDSSIRASFNVSSITRIQTAICTINFTNALVDSNYVVTSAAAGGGLNPYGQDWRAIAVAGMTDSGSAPTLKTTTQLMVMRSVSNSLIDGSEWYVAVFR